MAMAGTRARGRGRGQGHCGIGCSLFTHLQRSTRFPFPNQNHLPLHSPLHLHSCGVRAEMRLNQWVRSPLGFAYTHTHTHTHTHTNTHATHSPPPEWFTSTSTPQTGAPERSAFGAVVCFRLLSPCAGSSHACRGVLISMLRLNANWNLNSTTPAQRH